jgi:uncharacterized protein (DUF1015 family)
MGGLMPTSASAGTIRGGDKAISMSAAATPAAGTRSEMTVPAHGSLQLLPFRAVRYNAEGNALARVTAPPYDVIDDAQRAALAARDPHNVVRLILPEEPTDPLETHDRYTAAAATFDRWLDDATLVVDKQPALYVYQQSRPGVVLQRGLLGAVVMQPLDGGVILPHEQVRSGPVEDRLALMRALRGNPEPIFLLYGGGGDATRISDAATHGRATVSAKTDDGILHELWAITSALDLATIAADLAGRTAMIADGHHRYTTYGYLRDELHAAGEGSGPWDAGLTLLVDESAATPDIRAIHRVIPGFSLAHATAAASAAFRLVPLDPTIADVDRYLAVLGEQPGPAFMLSDGATFVLLLEPDAGQLAAAKPTERSTAWWALDASVASVFVMQRLWGVTDAAGQVEAEHDPAAALRLARETQGIALFVNPAPLHGIFAVARAGDAMPRKSTLFLPKPRSGIVMRSFRFEH